MVGKNRFEVKQIFDLPITLSLAELFDRSDTTIKEMAHYLQGATPRYRVKKSTVKATQPATGATNEQMSLSL